MSAYIPQVSETSNFAYPLLACNIDTIEDSDMFEWKDPHRNYSYYDMTKNLDELLKDDSEGVERTTDLFSRVAYWPHD